MSVIQWKDFALPDRCSQHFLQLQRSLVCTPARLHWLHLPHPSLGCLVSSSLAAHQARRPAGVSSASSRHGVGYSTAIPDSERRIFCQHSDHNSGGGELGWRADRKAAPARRGFDLKCGDVRDVAGEQARCILAPLHRPMLARDFTVANSS